MTSDIGRTAPATWSLALSGGGHRAALFALGSLLYLADSEQNRQVTSIASVSGGSLTNGVLMCGEDYNTMDGTALRAATKNLIRRCAWTGTVQGAWETRLIIAGWVVLALGGLFGLAEWIWGMWGLRAYGPLMMLVAAVLIVLLYESISRVAAAILNRMFFDSRKLRDVQPGIVQVLCASELQSKLHLYLSPRFVYNRCFSTAPTAPGPIRLSTAVQASACFPPVFPTRRLRVQKVGLDKRPARRVWLCDGGVYDNMGDEWARGLWEHGGDFALLGQPPDMLLIVNASASGGFSKAPWYNSVPILKDLAAILAESDVMYKETTATRRADLYDQFDLARLIAQDDSGQDGSGQDGSGQTGSGQAGSGHAGSGQAGSDLVGKLPPQLGGSLIHIATLATWPLTVQQPPAGVPAERYAQVQSELEAFGENAALQQARDRSVAVKTTLAALGVDDSTDLLWHGYMLTMVNFAVFEGHPWQPRGRADFEKLVRDSRTKP